MMMEVAYDDDRTVYPDVRPSDGSSHYFYLNDFKKTGDRWNIKG